MPGDRQLDDISGITILTYEQLRRALELIPDGQLAFQAAPLATTPAQVVIHACSADLAYCNLIDGGSRRVPFSADDEPSKAALLQLLADTQQTVADLLGELDEATLGAERKLRWRADPVTVRWVLLHMLRHKHYHTGQLNYIHFLLGIDEA